MYLPFKEHLLYDLDDDITYYAHFNQVLIITQLLVDVIDTLIEFILTLYWIWAFRDVNFIKSKYAPFVLWDDNSSPRVQRDGNVNNCHALLRMRVNGPFLKLIATNPLKYIR